MKIQKLVSTALFSISIFVLILINNPFISKVSAVDYPIQESNNYIPSSYIDLGQISDLVVTSDGKIWFVDYLSSRVIKITQSGEILRIIGRAGSNEGEFESGVGGVTVDHQGNLYVQTANKTHKFDSNGGYIESWELGYINAGFIHFDSKTKTLLIGDHDNARIVRSSLNGTLLDTFGTSGSGNGQFLDIQGISTDSNGKIYVVDSEPSCRVQVFSSTGTYLDKFGTCGVGDGELLVPRGIDVKSNGQVVVASTHGNKFVEYSSTGSFVRSWGVLGDADSELRAPYGIDFDSNGNYFVTDYNQGAIKKYTSNRTFVSAIRNSGLTAGKLTSPTSVAYDSIGNLYVLDNGSVEGRVQKFTNSGTYISTIIDSTDLGAEAIHMTIKDDELYIADHNSFKKFDLAGNLIFEVAAGGSGDGEFDGARGIAVDSQGYIYVGDMYNDRIQKFDSDGNYYDQWGISGDGDGEFGVVSGAIVIDSLDRIYVADNADGPIENTRVQVFDTDGNFIREIGSYGTGEGQFIGITGMAIDPDGNLQVVSNYHDPRPVTIQVFSPTGTFISNYGSGGSSLGQVYYPIGIVMNPLSDAMTIADTANHRVQLHPFGTRILNLVNSADVVSEEGSLVSQYFDPEAPGIDDISSLLYFGDYVVSDFTVDLSTDRNWESVTVNALVGESKALVKNLDASGAPGISATHSLYLVKKTGQTSVTVCPNAEVIEDVKVNCDSGYVLGIEDENLSSVNIAGTDYWKIANLTGTGAMSVTPASSNSGSDDEDTTVDQGSPRTLTDTESQTDSDTDTDTGTESETPDTEGQPTDSDNEGGSNNVNKDNKVTFASLINQWKEALSSSKVVKFSSYSIIVLILALIGWYFFKKSVEDKQ